MQHLRQFDKKIGKSKITRESISLAMKDPGKNVSDRAQNKREGCEDGPLLVQDEG
jgi:hypothetical protein